MKYYLPKDYKFKNIHDAGSKARMDVERIMEESGIIPVGTAHNISKNRLLHFIRTIKMVFSIPFTIRKGDCLILQYPVKYYATICKVTHLYGGNIITLIHDLSCFRKKHNTEKKEIELMNQSDAIIAHNDNMADWLQKNGYVGYNKKVIVESLNIFDFLSNSQSSEERNITWPLRKVAYAGQLARYKNKFLYELGNYMEGYTMNVYGKGFDHSTAANPNQFETKGFIPSDELIRNAEGDFGLVWDGDSIDSCSGNWGEYLKINNPHKVSLYIRCGLPIIIWDKAAMAKFVQEQNIGICISSLKDISAIYNNLSKEEYSKMYSNVQQINKLMSQGYFFKTALSKILSASNAPSEVQPIKNGLLD